MSKEVLDEIADKMTEVERNDGKVAVILMNARDYADIRQFSRDQIDLNNYSETIKYGLMSYIWGIPVYVNRYVTEILCLGEDDERALAIQNCVYSDKNNPRTIIESMYQKFVITNDMRKNKLKFLVAT